MKTLGGVKQGRPTDSFLNFKKGRIKLNSDSGNIKTPFLSVFLSVNPLPAMDGQNC